MPCALLPEAADWFTHRLLPLHPQAPFARAIEFFVYEVPKVLLLLVLIVFSVGIVRSFFTPERTRALLTGRAESAGNVLAAGLGVVTPFCSCSAVPLFIGFLTAGVPPGVKAVRDIVGRVWPWVIAGIAVGAGIISVVHALIEKGAALGTVLAFMMSVIALSLPEMIILRKVLRPALIGAFVGIVASGIVLVGFLFNALF